MERTIELTGLELLTIELAVRQRTRELTQLLDELASISKTSDEYMRVKSQRDRADGIIAKLLEIDIRVDGKLVGTRL